MGSGEGWLHELPNQQALVSTVAAFSYTVNRPEELAPALARAFAVFDSARPRPVHIELPINVMLASAEHLAIPEAVVRLRRPAGDAQSIAAAAELLAGAKTPLILAGGGGVRAAAHVRALAEALDAPVAMTTNGRGILPPDHPLGVHLSASMPATRALVEASDVVLAIGTEFGPTDYDMYEDGFFTIPGKLIRIDIDSAQIMRTRLPEIGIVGDSAVCAEQLLALVPQGHRMGAERAGAVAALVGRDLSPAMVGDLRLLNRVRDLLPQALIVGDSTQLVYAGNIGFAAATPGSYFNSATGYGTLGYGLPAGIGAKVGCPDRPVVVLAGDGGLQFSIAELASAVEAGAPVILLLHDNKGYGEIKSYMVSKNIAPLGVDLHTPDFAALGKAYGWHTERLSTVTQLEEAIRAAAERQIPSMLIFGDDLRAEAAAG
jgi:acetolactate synthase-1/2/3 large subunit